MAKLPQAVLDQIQEAAQRVKYGKITVVINETCPQADVIVEERFRVSCEDVPKPGMVAGNKIHHG